MRHGLLLMPIKQTKARMQTSKQKEIPERERKAL
jgi:hypothetical protein